MKNIARELGFLLLVFAVSSTANAAPKRPKVYRIAYVRILSSDPKAASAFYVKLGAMNSSGPRISDATQTCVWCELDDYRLYVHIGEQVVLIKEESPSPPNRIEEIVFEISDAKKMEEYLVAMGVAIHSSTPQLQYFDVLDPEGHRIGFVQKTEGVERGKKDVSLLPIIHTGFVVHDRAVEDHFYKDILGFRPYWHGGMKDDKDDWEALQVPDGTDWVEFMLNVPPDPSKHTLGVMNHIALGVPDIHAAHKQLLTNGMKLTEEPKLGRDGKWQLNVYDPDDTRVEFMEFTPVEKPCCSEFTGPHPKP